MLITPSEPYEWQEEGLPLYREGKVRVRTFSLGARRREQPVKKVKLRGESFLA